MRESAAPPVGPVCSRIRGFQEQELNNNSSTPAPDRLHHRLKNESVREYSLLQLSSWRGRLSFETRNVLGDILCRTIFKDLQLKHQISLNTHLIGCVLFGIYRQLQEKIKLPCSARIVSPRDITRSAFLAQTEPKLYVEIL